MATTSALRWRRSAAQLHALAKVEREIRATDPNGRRKYLREFRDAFPSYHSVLSETQLAQALGAPDVILVGDYHALAACQRYCAQLLAERASLSSRPLVLALEAIFARDQHVLDEWQRGEIEAQELRERIRYDLDWQYDWTPFYELLQSARACGAIVYGLDCMPRGDMRRIAARDRHAAEKLAEIRRSHPEAQILVLFGESHLAPGHLPAEIRSRLPQDRILTVLQNQDALYWKAAGERKEHVEAVRVQDDVVCVFNATPLEKYESYRLYLERWRCARPNLLDLAPFFYNLIEALLRFLNLDLYATQIGNPPVPVVDLLPEVHSRCILDSLRKLLRRKGIAIEAIRLYEAEFETRGACYVPEVNAIYAARFDLRGAAELATRFVCLASAGRLGKPADTSLAADATECFYRAALDHALVYLGSRILYPARPAVRETDYYALYSEPREAVERRSLYSYREYLEMLDVLLFHKDYEVNHKRYVQQPALMQAALQFTGEKFDFVTRELGLMLGSQIYEAYVAGHFGRRSLRALLAGGNVRRASATALYFKLARRVGKPRRELVA